MDDPHKDCMYELKLVRPTAVENRRERVCTVYTVQNNPDWYSRKPLPRQQSLYKKKTHRPVTKEYRLT
jgi:hypothetical protein